MKQQKNAQQELADEYNIDQTTVSDIWTQRRNNWAHINEG